MTGVRLRGRRPEPLQQRVTGGERPVRLPPNKRFLLAAHPDEWVILGGKVVPYLGRLTIAPGIDLVDKSGDLTAARTDAEKRGWIILPENIRDPDDPEETYLTVYDGHAGPVWCTEWEIVYPGSNQVRSDTQGYLAFLDWLMDEGHVPRPQAHVLASMRARLTDRYLELSDLAETVPSARPAAERTKVELEAVEKALAEAEEREAAALAGERSARRATGRKPSNKIKAAPQDDEEG